MLFYYVQIKDRHDPGVNIREKASLASFKLGPPEWRGGGGGGGGGRGALRLLAGILGGRMPYLNAPKIITA